MVKTANQLINEIALDKMKYRIGDRVLYRYAGDCEGVILAYCIAGGLVMYKVTQGLGFFNRGWCNWIFEQDINGHIKEQTKFMAIRRILNWMRQCK